MQNKISVDDSTQVGCEDINMSSRRERKSLEDEYDYYDTVAVYGEDDNENDDDWKERSYEEIEELIDESETPQEDNEEQRRAKAFLFKFIANRPIYLFYFYVVWKLEIYYNEKFYVVWKFCIAKFYYEKFYYEKFYYEKFNIKEVAHQYKSAVTSKKLHKIYIDVAFYYNTIIGE